MAASSHPLESTKRTEATAAAASRIMLQKLTPGEITRAVAKIRGRYDLYHSRFRKSGRLKDAFESRYRQALRARVDVSTFLLAEISAVEELIRREETRDAERRSSDLGKPKRGFADRILEEQRERILKYPDLRFHSDAREEVRRLLGALVELERAHWLALGMALRETAYSRYSPVMIELESQLRTLASLDKDGRPAGLSRLLVQLDRFPRDYRAIDREEQEYILRTAFFLHDLVDVVDRVDANYPALGELDRGTLRQTRAHLRGMVDDFRLKEFKRKR